MAWGVVGQGDMECDHEIGLGWVELGWDRMR